MMTNDIKERIKEYSEQGMGYKRIATELGLSQATVKSFLKRTVEVLKATCRECGQPISSLPHKRQKCFCSDKCRNAWWSKNRDKRNLRAIYEYVCPVCEKEFTAYGNPHRKYCSCGCYHISRRRVATDEK